jgi:hypothetical protein
MKKRIPLIIIFCVGTLFVLAIFLPFPPFTAMEGEVSVWFDILKGFAFVLGGGNLIRVTADKIRKGHPDRFYLWVTLVGFFGMLGVGLLQLGGPIASGGDFTTEGLWFRRIYDGIFAPCMAAIFSTLAFFVSSAAYRAFRAKNREATVLLIAAFVILLGRTPLGNSLTAWLPDSLSFLKIPWLFEKILMYPNTAGQRAILIGIALGIISNSLRLILGVERSYLGGEHS